MRRSLKALAALLTYPEARLVEALDEVEQAIWAEPGLDHRVQTEIAGLIAELRSGDLIDAQERYVALFDRSRSLSLHLFEHVHGDSRDRGPAMVDLLNLYRSHGFDLGAGELPDYLPAYLEYASLLDPAAGKAALAEVAHIVAPIRDRLTKRGSAYAALLDGVLALAEAPAPAVDAETEAADDDFEALDRAWEEAAVTFGPENAPTGQGTGQGDDCGRAQEILRRMNA